MQAIIYLTDHGLEALKADDVAKALRGEGFKAERTIAHAADGSSYSIRVELDDVDQDEGVIGYILQHYFKKEGGNATLSTDGATGSEE
jgi:hypothetical protein